MPDAPKQQKTPAFLAALYAALRGQTNADVARAGAEEVAQQLPSPVMPLDAIAEDRRRKALIDAQLQQATR